LLGQVLVIVAGKSKSSPTLLTPPALPVTDLIIKRKNVYAFQERAEEMINALPTEPVHDVTPDLESIFVHETLSIEPASTHEEGVPSGTVPSAVMT
jgi:hypothetical protein